MGYTARYGHRSRIACTRAPHPGARAPATIGFAWISTQMQRISMCYWPALEPSSTCSLGLAPSPTLLLLPHHSSATSLPLPRNCTTWLHFLPSPPRPTTALASSTSFANRPHPHARLSPLSLTHLSACHAAPPNCNRTPNPNPKPPIHHHLALIPLTLPNSAAYRLAPQRGLQPFLLRASRPPSLRPLTCTSITSVTAPTTVSITVTVTMTYP